MKNAVCYCNYAKHLILTGDFKKAQDQIDKALTIFAKVADSVPDKWPIYYAQGLFFEKKQNIERSKEFYLQCL